ncbi:T9SS type A sorting domain-containing protein [Hymenobacter sp. 102]|uniref:T9SS type A sorting domain-containing protein n=1 Tax=Hymenobacter sp. 102 TaxID=3403152 RepID=UPI003CF36537
MKAPTTLALACILGIFLSAVAGAAPARFGQLTGNNQPPRPQVRAYVHQRVLPTLRQQRQKLEARLSDSDRAQLAVYRIQLQELRQRGQTLPRSFAPPSSTPATTPAAPTPEQQAQLQQLRTEIRALLREVDKLAQPYTTDIAQLAQEVKAQQDQWATDIRALTAQGIASADTRAKRHRSRAIRFFRPATFLLLQPDSAAATPPPAPSQVYPNPAHSTSQLTYEVAKAGAVTVELLDGRGNTLRTVAQADKQEKGPHTLTVDVADLPAGTYFFKISTRAGAETRRFVKE